MSKPWFIGLSMRIRSFCLILFIALLVGCTPRSSTRPASTPTPTRAVSEALLQDAAAMADALGVPIEEALRRIQIGEAIGVLGDVLARQEAGTFAGLWVEHEPDYRVMVAFTQNGLQTLERYVQDPALADVIEIREAQITLGELEATQAELNELVGGLGVPISTGISVPMNRVELYVTDRTLFEDRVREQQIELPAHVEVITVYEPARGGPPVGLTPDPAIHMPQLLARSVNVMEALLAGTLVVEDGCLRVAEGGGDSSHLVIWQPDYFVNNKDGLIEILDREGAVIGRVGEQLRLGGGEIRLTQTLLSQLREPIPAGCAGPYWLMGELVPP